MNFSIRYSELSNQHFKMLKLQSSMLYLFAVPSSYECSVSRYVTVVVATAVLYCDVVEYMMYMVLSLLLRC